MTIPPVVWIGVAAAALMAAVLWYAFDAGGDARDSKNLKATTETQRRIDDADATGPRTPDDVDKRLRDGRF